MDSQVGKKWSCPKLICDAFRWFPMVCGLPRHENPAANVFNLLMSRLGSALGPIRSEFAFIRSDLTIAKQTQDGANMDPKCTQNRIQIDMIISEICFRSDMSIAGFF